MKYGKVELFWYLPRGLGEAAQPRGAAVPQVQPMQLCDEALRMEHQP